MLEGIEIPLAPPDRIRIRPGRCRLILPVECVQEFSNLICGGKTKGQVLAENQKFGVVPMEKEPTRSIRVVNFNSIAHNIYLHHLSALSGGPALSIRPGPRPTSPGFPRADRRKMDETGGIKGGPLLRVRLAPDPDHPLEGFSLAGPDKELSR